MENEKIDMVFVDEFLVITIPKSQIVESLFKFTGNPILPQNMVGLFDEIEKPSPFKFMHDKTRICIQSLVEKYGIETIIKRDLAEIIDMEWEHKIKDFSQIMKTLQKRGFVTLIHNPNKTRITYFTFKKNAQWT
jgi:hypothetical protein